MALQIPKYVLNNGLIAEDAFAIITNLNGNTTMTIELKLYISREAYLEERPVIDVRLFDFKPDISERSYNYHVQGYDYLKTIFPEAVHLDYP
ncbi:MULTISPECIES: hypothetical protein [Bacillus cereus group]|uniref:hypothetical protein n=1 Tax=Bacillus cereus group TaxID=86661 RepID=UPI0022E7FB8D|nr:MULTISPECIES: hypothetical protein [unclassified Bacillus cereus group]MDA2026713.1 hypothetical protein [Bacillus cereus group sp. Bcc03]MDA2713412.1 hypothetical protein [Bacillus cereus group sp. Bc025]HDR7716931.1 hypothetical protein [Bacillus albus]